MPRRDLAGARVLITGGAGGIGRAIGQRFARDGAAVVLVDIDVDRLDEAVARVGGAIGMAADITDADACAWVVRQVESQLGGVDVLVNNAGVTHRSAFTDTDPAVIERVMRVNYLGAITMTHAAAPALAASHGAIAVLTSVAGVAPILGRTGYVGAKHALEGSFATIRAELRPKGVDVTIVAPTFVATDMQARALDGDGSVTAHPQSRVGGEVSADDVADTLYRAIESRRRHVTIGAIGKLSIVLWRIAPSLYERLMTRGLRSELERDQ